MHCSLEQAVILICRQQGIDFIPSLFKSRSDKVLTPSLLTQKAKHLGLKIEYKSIPAAQLKQIKSAYILCLKDHQYIVVLTHNGNDCWIKSPEQPQKKE